MSRFLPLLLTATLLVGGSFALANGFGGDNPPSRIPVPARDFSATVVDKGGTVAEVSKVTWNGEVFVYGNLGDAQVTVPFEKVATVTVEGHADPKKRTAVVTMTSGESVRLSVDDDLLCYGRTSYGNYSIEAKHIGTVTLRGLTAP